MSADVTELHIFVDGAFDVARAKDPDAVGVVDQGQHHGGAWRQFVIRSAGRELWTWTISDGLERQVEEDRLVHQSAEIGRKPGGQSGRIEILGHSVHLSFFRAPIGPGSIDLFPE